MTSQTFIRNSVISGIITNHFETLALPESSEAFKKMIVTISATYGVTYRTAREYAITAKQKIELNKEQDNTYFYGVVDPFSNKDNTPLRSGEEYEKEKAENLKRIKEQLNVK